MLQRNNCEKEWETPRKEVGAGVMRVEKLLGYPHHDLLKRDHLKKQYY